MNISKEVKAFRAEKASELLRMADVLRRVVDPALDTQAIVKAATQLRDYNYIPSLRDGSRNANNWGYTIEDFVLPVTTDRHIKPDGVSKLELSLDMSIIANSKDWMTYSDPLLEMNFSVTVRGIKQSEKSTFHYLGFHIDRHIEDGSSEEPHPIYHIQYCVNPLAKGDFDYGSVLHLDTPRVMHYPLEFILGIGFLTSNFFPLAFDELLNDGTYVNLYRKYQEGIWRPYSHTLADKWPFDKSKITWGPVTNLCPLFV